MNDKPSAWSRAIALRAAVRVLPVLARIAESSESNLEKKRAERALLSALRISLLTYISDSESFPLLFGKGIKGLSSAIFRDSVEAFERAVETTIAKDDTLAAANAAATVDAASRALAPALSDNDLWLAVQSDINFLENIMSTSSDHQEKSLLRQPIWHDNQPSRLHYAWGTFSRSDTAENGAFYPWIIWYESLVFPENYNEPVNVFGEKISNRIASQKISWWNRTVFDINSEIKFWFDDININKEKEYNVQNDIINALDILPPQQAAPYLFDWRDGCMEVLPPDALREDGGIAQDYLDETREKAEDLLEALARSNTDPIIARKVGRLREVLTERAADLRPALVDSRSISVERLAKALDNPQDAAEMPARILADLGDLADTARRLCNCLPALWQRDAERLANSLTPDSATALLHHLDALRDGIKGADIIGPDVQAAFDTLSEDSAEPDADDVRRRRIAMFGLTARNLLTTLLRASKGAADKLVDYARNAGKEFYPELVKAPAKLTVGTGVNFAAACLVIVLLGATSGIAKFFPEINRVVRILEALRTGEGKPTTPPAGTEPPLSPSTPRPTAERGPTRPA